MRIDGVRYPFDAWYTPKGEAGTARLPFISSCEGNRLTLVVPIPFGGWFVVATPLEAR